MLLLLLLIIIVRAYRLRKSKAIHEGTAQHDPVTPFTYGPSHLPSAPLMGYISHSNINEEPPIYSPPGTQPTGYASSSSYPSSSSYSDPYDVVHGGPVAHRIEVVPPLHSGKSRVPPVSTRSLWVPSDLTLVCSLHIISLFVTSSRCCTSCSRLGKIKLGPFQSDSVANQIFWTYLFRIQTAQLTIPL